jgi:dTMP kinase
MDMKNKSMHPATEFLLFSSARAQLVNEKIKPHLEAGGVVIADRYYDSSLAYQGYGHGIPLDTIRAITNFATGGLTPDLTLLLDIDAESGQAGCAAARNPVWNGTGWTITPWPFTNAYARGF